MDKHIMRCIRCKGRKRIYKAAKGGYSYIDTGGTQVDCPMCLGEGTIKTLESAIADAEQGAKKSIKTKNKDLEDGEEKRSSSADSRDEAKRKSKTKASERKAD